MSAGKYIDIAEEDEDITIFNSKDFLSGIKIWLINQDNLFEKKFEITNFK